MTENELIQYFETKIYEYARFQGWIEGIVKHGDSLTAQDLLAKVIEAVQWLNDQQKRRTA